MKRLSFIAKELRDCGRAVNKEQNCHSALTYLDMVACALKYGASPNNYLVFDFKNATAEERKTFLTHRDNQKLMARFNKSTKIDELQNKYEFATKMGGWYGRKFAISDEINFDEYVDLTSCGKIIYKPLCGGQGRGIEVIEVNRQNVKETYKNLVSWPTGIVESWITQHDEMNRLSPNSVNPIRVQTLLEDDGVHILGATITIGNGTKIANASAAKSIFALVDIKNGRVHTDGMDYNGNSYILCPQTKTKIKGFQIPYWEQIIELLKDAGKVIPEVRLVGWDIAVTPNGPIVIEANNDAGYLAYQLPRLTKKHIGTRSWYEKYL